MKRTIIDRIIGIFSPNAEYERLLARARSEVALTYKPLLRTYDISKTYQQSEWVSTSSNDANEENRGALKKGRNKARALAQNAPYAIKAIDVIVNETIGAGIMANITSSNGEITEKARNIKKLWEDWCDSTSCDYENTSNYYGLQSLAMRSTVESGECIVLPKFNGKTLQIQILESDFIYTEQDGGDYRQGIKVDSGGRKIAYVLHKSHPGGRTLDFSTIEIPANELAHIYRKKRPGELRGVTWAHGVVEKIKDFDDYQFSTLVRQKVAACFGGFITTNGNDLGLTKQQLEDKRKEEFQLQPSTYKYLAPGEDFKQASPPGVDGYADFNRETLRAISSGWGISYESMTGDYSQSNYSSSRMGHKQMQKNIENWRWQMFIPQFCDITFKWFLEYLSRTGLDVSDIKVKWVPPAYTMIDPEKELNALNKEVRAGYKSWREAVQELGRDPDMVLKEIVDINKEFDKNGVILDIDPRKTSQQGLIQQNNKQDNNSQSQGDNTNDEGKETTSSSSDSSGY